MNQLPGIVFELINPIKYFSYDDSKRKNDTKPAKGS